MLAAPPSTFTCTLIHAHIKYNASFDIQVWVTIGYFARQLCRARNKSLHQRPVFSLQMGVNCLSLRHHLLPTHYTLVGYFHDACSHYAPVKVVSTHLQTHRRAAVSEAFKSPEMPLSQI